LSTTFWTDQNNYAYTHVQSYSKHHGFSEENLERSSKGAFDPLRKGQVLNLHGGMIFLVSGALSDLFGFFGVGVGFWYWLQLVQWESLMRMSWVCSDKGAVIVVVVVVVVVVTVDPT
jgi:hypothetical protein